MHITRVSIDNVPPLGNVAFDCDERVNLFIGPNASGKSTILRSINEIYHSAPTTNKLLAELVARALGGAHWKHRLDGDDGLISVWVSEDWPVGYDRMSNAVPQSSIPATRINIGLVPASDELWEFIEHFDLSYGEVLNGTYIQKAIDSLYWESTFSSNLILGEQLWIALSHGFSCAKSICREIIQDGPHPHLETGYDEKHGRTVDTHHAMGIGTIDDVRGTPLYARILSSGTQGTLLWVYVLAIRIAGHYQFEDGWEKKPAILLIDEIENHLHPTWQRRVIPALLEYFPGLQIFATTHSPFMVAGLKAGQVHLLNRDANGVVTATTHERDVIGWTADEILRTMMGVDEPTDQLTVDRANKLRQLREKETLTPDEESELNALRRQVNMDLMSKSGPLEAQRERYAELMERFLLSRQSDLTQDGE